MNISRLNGAYTPQECASNTNTSEVAVNTSEDNKEAVNYRVDYNVCRSKDRPTSGFQTQSKHLDSYVCKSKSTSDCQTKSKRLIKSENYSEVFAPPNKRIKIAQSLTFTESEILKQQNDDSQDDDDIDDSQEYDALDDSQRDGVSNDGRKDSCIKEDEEDLFYGTHETQVSEGGEADLQKHLVGCKKNPGHTKFVPVNDFDITHLPEGHHDNDLVQYIKAMADLTVRVAVKMTSTERPEVWPNTTVPYAFYNMRGSDVMRVGTGKMCAVIKWTEEYIKKYNMGTCRCHKCQHSDTPSKVWGKVEMFTATHVVFDDLEARHTACRLFFDRQDSPLVTLDGWTMIGADIEKDGCWLKCVTCDVDLLDKLDKMWGHWFDLWLKVNNKYMSSRDEVKLTLIVSHPHGCPKQVSVGQWINRYELDMDDDNSDDKMYDDSDDKMYDDIDDELYDDSDDDSDDDIFDDSDNDDEYQKCGTKYTYTTCTCPGSSGAWVHPLGYDGGWLSAPHVHSGVNSKGNNFSAIGQERF